MNRDEHVALTRRANSLGLATRCLSAASARKRRNGALILLKVMMPDRLFSELGHQLLMPLLSGETDADALAAMLLALGAYDTEAGVRLIAQYASHTSRNVRIAVARALPPDDTDIPHALFLPELLRLCGDEHHEVRRWAMLGLHDLPNGNTSQVCECLARNSNDCDELVRAAAIEGLARRGDDRALPALIGAFRDGQSTGGLFSAAEWLGTPALLPYLLEFEEDADVARAIARCQPVEPETSEYPVSAATGAPVFFIPPRSQQRKEDQDVTLQVQSQPLRMFPQQIDWKYRAGLAYALSPLVFIPVFVILVAKYEREHVELLIFLFVLYVTMQCGLAFYSGITEDGLGGRGGTGGAGGGC